MGFQRRQILGMAGAIAGTSLLSAPAQAGGHHRRVYLGSYTSAGGGGVGLGRLNSATGQLVIEDWFDAVADPSWADLSPDRRSLYTTSELVPDGIVSAFRLDEHGRPRLANSQPTGQGPVHVAVHPSGRHLFTSLYTTGSVVAHAILPDRTVGSITDTEVHAAEPGQVQARTHQVVTDPSARWILSADLGVDAVFVSRFHSRTGQLGPAQRVRFKAGSGPRHLVFHPHGRFVYVACEQDSTVAVCRWRDGVLTPVQTLPTLLEPPSTRNYPAEIAVSGDGRFVYVSNRGHNSVAVFAVSQGGASLRLIATPSCGGTWPRHMTIDPSGNWLYLANQQSNEVVWFRLDRQTGLPVSEPAGRVSATAVTQVRIV
ncbi:lactonase family protein [Catelliglobosispora koreensis]|uniref:lactonase family protein n=1 Tax=Catelliglobosispora koreensis TaxID=129052 RepID=UPI0003A23F36|nr:lactonase family protein [Catelliglobosispora koreensis]